MTHLVRLVVAVCIALLFNSCRYDINSGEKITGSGKVISEERKVKDFTRVEVSDGLDCEVTQGDKTEVIVEADDNLQNGIITTVENGTLKITSIYNNYHNVASKKIKVQLPKILGLETGSGCNLITKNTLKGEDISLKASSGSELEAGVEADKITLESSSGSTLIVGGKALTVSTASSSGSTIDAGRLLANDITSQSSSGSNSIVNPIVSLKAHASSGSSIEYEKAPKKLVIEKNSAGDVSLK
ncbi:head GIN domain-containing protein [Flavobacterium sp.]|uniref:head GIN domain-containing protein n=1 Tax=Flavobacterium sp. TaxID=239 RepID=UPI003D6A012F